MKILSLVFNICLLRREAECWGTKRIEEELGEWVFPPINAVNLDHSLDSLEFQVLLCKIKGLN